MLKILQGVHPLILLLIATTLEVSGDAVVRMAIYITVGVSRFALFLAGAALLFGYGSFLNFAPVEFGRVVGLYIATLFVVWQLITSLPLELSRRCHLGRRRVGDRGRGIITFGVPLRRAPADE